MSRRPPNPNAERAAHNTQTIKSLLKLEGNKSCADCKRNKHPRWASWNLGIFVCIRCSGIHRGMGTHISRVKSVDLDSWTDEQLQSVLRWGNARANKYWEAKLAPGHIPSEAKIENFIRTKYESKRWVMEGPIPDPSTLDVEGDDDVPLNLVKEKHNLDRSSQRSPLDVGGPSQIKRAQQPDMFSGESISRQNSIAGPPTNRVQPKSEAAPPKQTKPADSLLGLDFFGAPAPPTSRPGSTVSAPGGQSRPDLKQSILSLYSTTPKPQPTQQSQQAFGGFVSPQSPPSNQTSQSHSSQSSFGGMQDAFSSLSFSQPTQAQASKPSAFAALGNLSSQKSTPSITSPPSTGYGGSFFDSKPANRPAPAPAPQPNRTFSSSSGFGAFDSAPGISPMAQTKAGSGLEDLFDFGTSSTVSSPPKQTIASPPAQASVFNLSAPQPSPKIASQPPAASSIGWGNNSDAWGSNDAWSTPDPTPKSPTLNKPLPPMQTQAPSNDFGWGSASGNPLAGQSIAPSGGGGFNTTSSPPKVTADEDFGGWSSAVPVTPAASAAPAKSGGGFGASEDLFSNVWE